MNLVPFGAGVGQAQLAAAARELESCNSILQRHGLSLSRADIQAIVSGRLEALGETDRVEFGGGVAADLVLSFAGSPHLSQADFVPTILELQALFYEFKNESLEQVADDELIAKMRALFDDPAQGDLEYLAEALFDGLARHIREVAGNPPSVRSPYPDYSAIYDDASAGYDDAADPEADRAAANAHTLAAARFNISEWVDETYSPAWEGSSWLDE